ncbi:DUF898 domain-containing protein [Enterovibrio makurazakiensis]|uniref:YjgN family protein n=1 Tax=Enterovibrio makurazakiensis TaxID=2910232 RepID=UPI003D25CBCC
MKNKMIFHGSGREFFNTWIMNVVMSVLTLGLYSAWAKVRTKKYFYGQTELAGDRFDYHDSPVRILFWRVIFFVTLVVCIFFVSHSKESAYFIAIVFLMVSPWFFRRNLRVNAGMTSYRNKRFNFNGTLIGAYKSIFVGSLVSLLIFSLGMIFSLVVSPQNNLLVAIYLGIFFVLGLSKLIYEVVKYVNCGYEYGGAKFGTKTDISKVFCFVVSLVSLLIFSSSTVGVFYLDWKLEDAVTHYTLEGVSSRMSMVDYALYASKVIVVKGLFYAMHAIPALMVFHFLSRMIHAYVFNDKKMMHSVIFVLSNMLARMLTLGFLTPWVRVREYNYFVSSVIIDGDLDVRSDIVGYEGMKSNSKVDKQSFQHAIE